MGEIACYVKSESVVSIIYNAFDECTVINFDKESDEMKLRGNLIHEVTLQLPNFLRFSSPSIQVAVRPDEIRAIHISKRPSNRHGNAYYIYFEHSGMLCLDENDGLKLIENITLAEMQNEMEKNL